MPVVHVKVYVAWYLATHARIRTGLRTIQAQDLRNHLLVNPCWHRDTRGCRHSIPRAVLVAEPKYEHRRRCKHVGSRAHTRGVIVLRFTKIARIVSLRVAHICTERVLAHACPPRRGDRGAMQTEFNAALLHKLPIMSRIVPLWFPHTTNTIRHTPTRATHVPSARPTRTEQRALRTSTSICRRTPDAAVAILAYSTRTGLASWKFH